MMSCTRERYLSLVDVFGPGLLGKYGHFSRFEFWRHATDRIASMQTIEWRLKSILLLMDNHDQYERK